MNVYTNNVLVCMNMYTNKIAPPRCPPYKNLRGGACAPWFPCFPSSIYVKCVKEWRKEEKRKMMQNGGGKGVKRGRRMWSDEWESMRIEMWRKGGEERGEEWGMRSEGCGVRSEGWEEWGMRSVESEGWGVRWGEEWEVRGERSEGWGVNGEGGGVKGEGWG